jgi:hypothetical protein
MPESNEKERKLKVKLEKKARRMMRRRRTAMIGHFGVLSLGEQIKFAANAAGDALGNRIADAALGN